MHIRPFDLSHDLPNLLAVWQAALGEKWPQLPSVLERIALDRAVYHPGDHLLAEIDDQVVGFALTQTRPASSLQSGILAIGVHPNYRRRGIGRALLAAAEQRLREQGAAKIRLGAGGQRYFWPGVPCNLPDAWEFFRHAGWEQQEISVDLACSLRDYQTPEWVWQRVRPHGVELRCALPSDQPALLDLIENGQPGWLPYYQAFCAQQRWSDIVVAVSDQQLLGACLIEGSGVTWAHLIHAEGQVGAPGALLVAEAAREKGIGLALAALATEQLRDRGFSASILGWTWLVEWYGRLGYTVWQEYRMSEKQFLEDRG